MRYNRLLHKNLHFLCSFVVFWVFLYLLLSILCCVLYAQMDIFCPIFWLTNPRWISFAMLNTHLIHLLNFEDLKPLGFVQMVNIQSWVFSYCIICRCNSLEITAGSPVVSLFPLFDTCSQVWYAAWIFFTCDAWVLFVCAVRSERYCWFFHLEALWVYCKSIICVCWHYHHTVLYAV